VHQSQTLRVVRPLSSLIRARGSMESVMARRAASGPVRTMSASTSSVLHADSGAMPAPASILVVTERPRNEDLFPVRLTVDDVLVRPHRPELQQREPHVLPEVFLALRRLYVRLALVPVRRANVGLYAATLHGDNKAACWT
jgi:hypothetical protein